MKAKKSRNALDGKMTRVASGVHVYKVNSSPYYKVRVWIPSERKRITRTTKEKSRAQAIKAAEEFVKDLGSQGTLKSVPQSRTFQTFADKLVVYEKLRGSQGKLNKKLWRNTKFYLEHKDWGVLERFGKRDITKIRTTDYHSYMRSVETSHPELAAATMNHIASAFAKVMKLAVQEGMIDNAPATPRVRRKDNPRPYFRFDPLVSKKDDEYKKLLKEAKKMAADGALVRGIPVTEELRDLILFLTHSFLRPTEGEIYGLTHRDVTQATNPKRLVLNVRHGKTGARASNTMEACVSVYERIKARNPNHQQGDYLFLPDHQNRETAKRIMQRQFNALLERCDLKSNKHGKGKHSLYSLRHTAICMRLILSQGEVNIFNLAKNAGTSVDQIERFYAAKLPATGQMAKNLHAIVNTNRP